LAGAAGPAIPGGLPVRLVAGDLNGDGLDDLAVLAAGSGTVDVFYQTAAGGFGAPAQQTGVGVGPAEIILADLDGDRRPDLVVTNRFTGDVSVLLNTPAAPFARELRFRADPGLYGVAQPGGRLAVRSEAEPVGVAAGTFDAGGTTAPVVAHSGSNRLSVLLRSGTR